MNTADISPLIKRIIIKMRVINNIDIQTDKKINRYISRHRDSQRDRVVHKQCIKSNGIP